MSGERTLKITNTLIASVLIVEALALLFGMLFCSQSGTEWLTTSNIVLLSLDMAMGILLISFSFKLDKILFYMILFFIVATIIGSHIYRNIDFAINSPNAFAFNIPLLVVNNLKLIGALYSIGLIIYLLLNWEDEKKLVIKDLE